MKRFLAIMFVVISVSCFVGCGLIAQPLYYRHRQSSPEVVAAREAIIGKTYSEVFATWGKPVMDPIISGKGFVAFFSAGGAGISHGSKSGMDNYTSHRVWRVYFEGRKARRVTETWVNVKE